MISVRERITRGINRRRLMLEAKRATAPLIVIAIASAFGLAGAVWILTHLTATLLKETYEVRFEVSDASGVLPKVDKVRYRGIEAGTITGVEREGERIVLVAEIAEEYGPLYRDVRAELRPQTPLQDMYLDVVDPGTPQAGELDGTVPASQTKVSVRVDEVLAVFEPAQRARLRSLLHNLGNGLADRGAALRRAVAQLEPLLRVVGRITEEVDRRREVTRRLVANARVLTAELGKRDRQLRRLTREGTATFGTLQESSAQLDATLRALPGALREASASLTAVHGVVDDVDEAVTSLYPVAERASAALEQVRELEEALGPAVARLHAPVRRLQPLTRVLTPAVTNADRAVAALRPQADTIEKVTRGLVLCEKAVIGFFQWNTSLTKFGDVRGPVPRGNLAIQVPDTGLPGVAKRAPAKNCAGGRTIGGRPSVPEDEE